MRLRPYQQDAVASTLEAFKDVPSALGVAATGMGKAQPLHCKLLTPDGWIKMGDVKIGDIIAGRDGWTTVQGVYPQDQRQCYTVVFTDDTETQCCDTHLWAVQTKSQKSRGAGFTDIRLCDLWDDLTDGYGALKWFVPINEPIAFPTKTLAVDPYVMGMLLGNGGLIYRTMFSTPDQFVVDEMARRLPGAIVTHVENYDYSITYGNRGPHANPLTDMLRDIGIMGKGSPEKFVPSVYLYADEGQRLNLLRGLMDSDGHVRPSDGHTEFSTTSKQLAQDVCFLVRSLGGCTRVRYKKPGTYTHNGENRVGLCSYRVTVTINLNPFLVPRKAEQYRTHKNQGRTKAIKEIRKADVVECQCISVAAPDGLYLTDDFIVTHNTIIFAHLVKHFTAHGKRAMVIAHREELINQAAAKIQSVAGIHCDIEMASKHADVGMFNRSPVVVASVQTLATGRLNKFNPDDFGLIVIDEAHHAVAKSYQRPIDHILSNPKAKAFGVTATPDRTDELALGRVFDRAAFDYDIDFGVSESWLVPIKARSIPVDGLDFSQIRSTCGDLNESELAALMEAEGPLHEIADPTVQLVGDRKALVFAVSVRHAELLAEIFNRHKEGCARWVCGATPKMERQQIIADFAARRFQYLVNVGVFTEGFDDPTIDVVVMGRPTESRALFAQMVGRGTRPIPHARIDDYPNDTRQRAASIAASSKPSVEILDFVANAGNHQLVSVGDLLGGDYDSEIVAKVKQRQETEAVDFREACEEAVAEKKAREEARILAERDRRRQLIARADYQIIDLDPFDVLGLRPIRRREWDRGKPLSTPMLEKLRREGVPNPEQLSYAAARRLVHETFARKYKGAPSYRQAAALKYVGLNVPGTAAEAGRLIDSVKRGEAVTT